MQQNEFLSKSLPMKKPIISIIIPTYSKSPEVLEISLKSIANQKCPKSYYEIIIADNNGGAAIESYARKYDTKLVRVNGKPPQTCRQVNLGASMAKGRYIFLVDHDLELEPHLIGNFVKKIEKEGKEIDAWYVPYQIMAHGFVLNKIRNFEEKFYRNSVIAAARIIKKDIFWKTESQYDPILNAGPGDWDLTLQLKVLGARFGYIDAYVRHHEEDLNFWEFMTKKKIYARGGEIYKEKWRKKNKKIYQDNVKKQFDPLYRLFIIFVEKGKWRELVLEIHLYLLFLTLKVTMSVIYFLSLVTKK